MRRLSQFSLCLVLAAAAGCTSVPPVMTHITSDPPGARIEVNNGYVGTTPVDVALPQTPNHHRLKSTMVIAALPVAPGQKLQQKIFEHRQLSPAQIWFDMTLDPQAASVGLSTPPSTNQQPAEAKPVPSP